MSVSLIMKDIYLLSFLQFMLLQRGGILKRMIQKQTYFLMESVVVLWNVISAASRIVSSFVLINTDMLVVAFISICVMSI